jgi:hypothetical protein
VQQKNNLTSSDLPNSPEHIDMEDSHDPYPNTDDHYINWEGCGLFWDIPFFEEYYNYHNM